MGCGTSTTAGPLAQGHPQLAREGKSLSSARLPAPSRPYGAADAAGGGEEWASLTKGPARPTRLRRARSRREEEIAAIAGGDDFIMSSESSDEDDADGAEAAALLPQRRRGRGGERASFDELPDVPEELAEQLLVFLDLDEMGALHGC